MNSQLLLENVRQVLIRIEDTILFALIERAQWRRNDIIYNPGAFPELTDKESLSGYLLHETEKIHSLMRRYTRPDEIPFFGNLPSPRLPPLSYAENPLRGPMVNLNNEIRKKYADWAIPLLCLEGDDGQYGSSAVCDVTCLQAISRRIHYGRFVAESKYRRSPRIFDRLIESGDIEGLRGAITHSNVEQDVVERVRHKAGTYLAELQVRGVQAKPDAEVVAALYRDWIIPGNKRVQLQYLLQRAEIQRESIGTP